MWTAWYRQAMGFNTPEGVEGFSSWFAAVEGLVWGEFNGFNTPEGVEGFSSRTSDRNPAAIYPD